MIVLAVLRHDQHLADNGRRQQHRRFHRPPLARRDDPPARRRLSAAGPAPEEDREAGGEVVLVDGTLIAAQRRTGRDNQEHFSGKHHHHGLHFLALTDEKGRLIWISAARPSRTHDAAAARHDHLVEHLKVAGLGALADLGILGVDKRRPR